MKSSKTFNNISAELKSKIPKLNPNDSVVFKMTNGVPNPEPDEKERSKDPILYSKVQLLTKFRVFDPYQVDESGQKVGGYVDVGCVESWKGDDPQAFRCFVPGVGMSRFPGKFELKGGVVADEELFEILWLSPQRKGGPCPDSSVEVVFEIQDTKSESKATVSRFETLKKALDLTTTMKPEKAREMLAALNQPTYQDDEVLMAKIKEFASTKPKEFIDTYESEETPIRAIIRQALNENILGYDLATGEVKMGGTSLMVMKSESFDTFVQEFSKWVTTASNGKDVLNNIQSRMNKKETAK